MTWILFIWIYGRVGTAVTSQEFNTHKACVEAAQSLRRQFEADSGFVCVEKGKVK